jgi:DNA phosphorothioation system restriction enzyme
MQNSNLNLKSIEWKNFYTTSGENLIKDFFEPALKNSIQYDRGVGYFSSGWIKAASKGLLAFAKNKGKARWLTSPVLSENDWKALELGHSAQTSPILKKAILASIQNLEQGLEENLLSAIAWMIADGILTFKLALPRNQLEHGNFHDKFGIFSDPQGQMLSFNGSYNDSIQGLRNYESIKVFCSWKKAFSEIVQVDAHRFQDLWNNEDSNVRVFDLPEAAKEKILQLRKTERPYPKNSEVVSPQTSDLASKNNFLCPPAIRLRNYQKNAIKKWFAHKGRGILSMATGSGKTITSLCAAKTVFDKLDNLFLCVVVPYINLARQWKQELEKFGLKPISCYGKRSDWSPELLQKILAASNSKKAIVPVIVVNNTFVKEPFQKLLNDLRLPIFLLADEVHNLGAARMNNCLDERFQFRLGLSATPERHCDEKGTAKLMDFFGGVIYEFSLADAIKEKILTEYEYYPITINLTTDEMEEYFELSKKITKIMAFSDIDQENQALKTLLIRRARLIAAAKEKIPAMKKVMKEAKFPLTKTLVYCGDGSVEEENSEQIVRQIEAATLMLGKELKLKVRRYTSREDLEDKEEILKDIKSEKIDAVLAIRCLDEGVDVPELVNGFILASSTNPRQYIQRRGRLLRKAENKNLARIYDFIVVPPIISDSDDCSFEIERKLFLRELKRILEFASTARNGMQALDSLTPLRKRYNLLGVDY